MSKRRRTHGGVSLGTWVMLLMTCAVLAGFFLMLPKLTGHPDIRTDAAKLAVAMDSSLSQLLDTSDSIASADWMRQPAQSLPPIDATTPWQTAEPTATAAPATPPPTYRFSLCAAGSFNFNSTVQKALTVDGAYQFDLMFDQLGDALRADLSLATLENSVIPSQKPSNSNLPAEAVAAMRGAGINTLCLGYIGALNQGIAGLAETQQSLRSAGITPYGVCSTRQEREALTVQSINGVQVALLSYQSELNKAGKKSATAEEQSYAIAAPELPVIVSEIQAVRQRGAQVVIVSLCWGKAGATEPTTTQRELAQAIADAGADIILGTHPGALQTVEVLAAERGDNRYHPVLCAYSLGNLFTHDREKRVSIASVLLKATVEYDSATGCVAFDNLTYTPTYAWRGKENGITRYRVLLNDGETYPSFVDKDQKGVMERCLKLVRDVMKDSPIPSV